MAIPNFQGSQELLSLALQPRQARVILLWEKERMDLVGLGLVAAIPQPTTVAFVLFLCGLQMKLTCLNILPLKLYYIALEANHFRSSHYV